VACAACGQKYRMNYARRFSQNRAAAIPQAVTTTSTGERKRPRYAPVSKERKIIPGPALVEEPADSIDILPEIVEV